VLPNSARAEWVARVLGEESGYLLSTGNKFYTSPTVKIVQQNEESANMLNMFKAKTLTVNKNVPGQVVKNARAFVRKHKGNVVFVVTLPENKGENLSLKWQYDTKQQFWTLFVYIDLKNLSVFTGRDIATDIHNHFYPDVEMQ